MSRQMDLPRQTDRQTARHRHVSWHLCLILVVRMYYHYWIVLLLLVYHLLYCGAAEYVRYMQQGGYKSPEHCFFFQIHVRFIDAINHRTIYGYYCKKKYSQFPVTFGASSAEEAPRPSRTFLGERHDGGGVFSPTFNWATNYSYHTYPTSFFFKTIFLVLNPFKAAVPFWGQVTRELKSNVRFCYYGGP